MIFPTANNAMAEEAYGINHSGDLDKNGYIDIDDLQIFSQQWFGTDWDQIDWCDWIDQNIRKEKHLRELYGFIFEYFGCDSTEPPDDPFAIVNSNNYPVRLALGLDYNLYVTDFKAGSVFIYNPNLVIIGELKGLDKPLGVTVDTQGNIFVGNSGRKNVERYNSNGVKTAIVATNIEMPNDLEFDANGNLYVVDSKANLIRVFDPNFTELPSIGAGKLRFPSAIDIAFVDDGTEELYIAGHVTIETNNPDYDNNSIKVYDLQGNFKRSFGPAFSGWWSVNWKGRFTRAQSIQFGPDGNLHVLDTTLANVQIIDRDTGAYISHYGTKGTGPGQMDLPLDIEINDFGEVIVANHRNKRVEIIYTIP